MTRGPYKNIYHFYSNVYGANGVYTDRKAILNILFWFYITNYIQGQLLIRLLSKKQHSLNINFCFF